MGLRVCEPSHLKNKKKKNGGPRSVEPCPRPERKKERRKGKARKEKMAPRYEHRQGGGKKPEVVLTSPAGREKGEGKKD